MDLMERVINLAVGGVIGFILGLIVARLRDIKKELHEVAEHQHDERGSMRLPRGKDIVLFIVVALVAYSAFVSQKASNDLKHQTEQDQIVRCKGAVDTRTVQRDTVDAIYDLALSFLPKDAKAENLTEEQKAEYNAYIDRVEKFRTDMYAKIHPSDACKEYVDDDNVQPPGPGFTHF